MPFPGGLVIQFDVTTDDTHTHWPSDNHLVVSAEDNHLGVIAVERGSTEVDLCSVQFEEPFAVDAGASDAAGSQP